MIWNSIVTLPETKFVSAKIKYFYLQIFLQMQMHAAMILRLVHVQ